MQQTISATYHANYNGFDISSNEHCAGENEELMAIENQIIDWAVDFCSEDGEFEGDKRVLESKITDAIHAVFPGCIINYQYDTFST